MSQRNVRGSDDRPVIDVEVSVPSSAPAEAVYGVLADLGTHLEWNGAQQPEKSRLLTLDAPAGPAAVGTEFQSTGKERSATFADRSVVTEADSPSTFEFVTESRRTPKRGKPVIEMTSVSRYEIVANGTGCRIDYRYRMVRVSSIPAPLRIPLMRKMVVAEGKKNSQKGLKNLVLYAGRRAGLTGGR